MFYFLQASSSTSNQELVNAKEDEIERPKEEKVESKRLWKPSDVGLTKSYRCKINIDFPETEEEQQIILTNITDIVKNMTESPIDLDFIRDKVLDEYDTEITFMDFEHLASMDLRDLPWSTIKFEAIKLTKGSAFLNFNVRFEKAPKNIEDVNVYRLMELFIKSTIENIQFIKSVHPKIEANQKRCLTFRLQAKRTTFDDDRLEILLSHVRGTIKHVLGETGDLTDEKVEAIHRELLATTSDQELRKSLLRLSPRSLRELIKEISKMAEKDVAEITFEFETTGKKNKSTKESESPSTCWLFPFDFRKIDDLPEEAKGVIMTVLTKRLPKGSEVWCEFLTNLQPTLTISEIDSLQEELVRVPMPYLRILKKFSDNGGTLGGLLQAMETLRSSQMENPELSEPSQMSQDNVRQIEEYIAGVKEVQKESFDEILANVYCPSPIPHVTSLQQFEEMIREHRQKLKTNVMRRFSEVQETLREGDQLWIFHKRMLMRSYAHVVIIGCGNSYIHVNSPGAKQAMRSRARICKDDFTKLQESNDLCFVVRPEVPDGAETLIFGERAKVCVGIRLDYDAESCNCETFANAVHGNWGQGIQASFNWKI